MRTILFAVLALFAASAAAESYQFTVTNNSDTDIVRIEVSEDDERWERFDIGSGIDSEDSAVLEWDASTNSRGCEWRFRATFRGGFVAYSDWVDFCEDDVVIEFDFD